MPTITHPLRSLYRWGITLLREIWGFGSTLGRYSYTTITICWCYCADFWLCGGTTKTSKLFCTDKGLSINMDKTKVWWCLTPTLLYGVETWGPSLKKAHHWKDLEKRPLVSMIVPMIRSNESVPHDIIQAEVGAAPIIIEALFRSVTFIQRLWELLKRRYPTLSLMSSRQLAKNGEFIVGLLKCNNGSSHVAWG